VARWVDQYGGVTASAAKHLKELAVENARLWKFPAEIELDRAIPMGTAEGNFRPRTANAPRCCCATGSGCLNDVRVQ
jgi:hypothetical protein